MVAQQISAEALLAELTDAAYASALRHQSRLPAAGVEYAEQESFLELELEIWKSLRRVLERRLPSGLAGRTDESPASEPSATNPARRLAAEVARDLSETSLSLAEWQA